MEGCMWVVKSSLFCQQIGVNGEPTVVLHGGPGLGSSYLLPQMEQLGQFTKAYFYDQRGTGLSVADDSWYDNPLQTYVQDLEALRLELGFERINLVAHSWGSILASLYTLAYPQHVNKLVYITPVPISSQHYLDFVQYRTEIINRDKDILDPIRQSQAFIDGDPETVIKYYRIYFKSYFHNLDLIDKLTLSFTPQSAVANFRIFEMFFNYVSAHPFDLYQPMKNLNKPALIIAGDEDAIPMHYNHLLLQNFPQGKLEILNKCGHFPYIEQPDRLFHILQDYI